MKLTTIYAAFALALPASAFRTINSLGSSALNVRTKTSSPLQMIAHDDFAHGLPGSVPPIPKFDPLGFSGTKEDTVRRFREVEIKHGRVAMLATIGLLAQEAGFRVPPFGNFHIMGAGIYHWQQIPAQTQVVIVSLIAFAELLSIPRMYDYVPPQKGWAPLRKDYRNGDLGFDPLNLSPKEPVAFMEMQERELNNGRLAMIAWAGMVVQELVDYKGIADHWWG